MVLDPFSSLAGVATLCQIAIQAGAQVKSHKENCANLVRRLQMLVPLIEEVRSSERPMTEAQLGAFYQLEAAIEKAKLLLEDCKCRSKMYMVYKGIAIIQKFKDVCLELDRCLSTLPLVQLHVSDQIRHQVQELSYDLRGAKFVMDSIDQKISEEIGTALRAQREGLEANNELLKKLAAHLEITSKESVKKEAQSLIKDSEKLAAEKEHLEKEYLDQIIWLLLKVEEKAVDNSDKAGISGSQGDITGSKGTKLSVKIAPTPPDELRCPISLELMYDPVIAGSGQTFERALIQKWLDEGHRNCPITRQPLLTEQLIPNIAVRKMIASWCEEYSLPLPTPPVLPPKTSPSGRVLEKPVEKPEASGSGPSNDEEKPLDVDAQLAKLRLLAGESGPSADTGSMKVGSSALMSSNGGLVMAYEQAGGIEPLRGTIETPHKQHVVENIPSTKFSKSWSVGATDALQVDSVARVKGMERSASLAPRQTEAGTFGSGLPPTQASWLRENRPVEELDHSWSAPVRHVRAPPSRRLSAQSLGSAAELSDKRPPSQWTPTSSSRQEPVIAPVKVRELVERMEKANSFTDLQGITSELRHLTKHSSENREQIAAGGAIRPLVRLVTSYDCKVQENAVTALLNLSINDSNKVAIVQAGAISSLVQVLRGGVREAQENAAATLYSLSVIDENKVLIGQSGAIACLVDLLHKGTERGKKDAATALFNLSIFHGNKTSIVRAGALPYLLSLASDPAMQDKAIAVIANLATVGEGRVAVGDSGGVEILVKALETGSPRSQENAAAALLQLCINSSRHSAAVQAAGAAPLLMRVAQIGTQRARDKANALLRLFKEQSRLSPRSANGESSFRR